MFKFALVLVLVVVAVGANGVPKNFEKSTYLGDSKVDENGTLAKQYIIAPTMLTFVQAVASCKNIEAGQLAQVETSTEHANLRRYLEIQGLSDTFFLGGMRSSYTEPFFWTSGNTPIPVTNFVPTPWIPGEPSTGNVNCICTNGIGSSFGWETCPCHYAFRYICEYTF